MNSTCKEQVTMDLEDGGSISVAISLGTPDFAGGVLLGLLESTDVCFSVVLSAEKARRLGEALLHAAKEAARD